MRSMAAATAGFLAFFLLATLTVAASGPAVAFKGSIDIATGRGERGPWQQNHSRYDYVDDPTVDMDDRGEISVAWTDQRRRDIFFQRFSPGGTKRLDNPVNISGNPETFSWLPRIVVPSKEPRKIYVLWQEIIFSGGSHGGDILFSRSDNGGKTFSKPLNLSKSMGGDGKGRINRDIWANGSLDLTAAADGTIFAAWTDYAGVLWLSSSGDDGKTFNPPRRVAGSDGSPARAPSLAAGRGRTLYLAWTVGEDSSADIRFTSSSDGGASFGEPRVVGPGAGYSDTPKLAVDRNGVLHLAWAESAGGPFDRYHIRYTRSTNGGQSFSQPKEISKPEPRRGAGGGFPSLDVDGKGSVYVLWELFPDRRQGPRGLGLVVSRDGGRTFLRPGVVPGSADRKGTNGSHQGLLMRKLAVNSAGALAIVNSSLRQNESSRVWLIRGS